MQFVKNGPDVPEHLIQQHEEGRVVFFCGAGISYPAGLPGFGDLVRRIVADLSISNVPTIDAALNEGRYDTAIGLLEGEIAGGRRAVREKLAKILTPDLQKRNAIRTHESLLTLSRGHSGQHRLVTTNFDRLFEHVIAVYGLQTVRFEAPFLPVPKNRWNGVVYLHGLLAETPTEENLNRLVVSSGDFGLAYLNERWASRFVSELFRGYTVCFVGYSINDPVLRYMMDALAADRLMGEAPTEAFAFGSFEKGKEQTAEQEWRSKNVTPILYRETPAHTYLHRTLKLWAATYKDRSRGREAIVTRHASVTPSGSTAQDDFVGRMLWALSDKTGLPAKRFAEFDPLPSLEWLEALADRRFRYRDLPRFRVPPNGTQDVGLNFSLVKRPTPYTHAPWMSLTLSQCPAGRWDEIMEQIARWLSRHLDDQNLLIWIAKGGGQLHPQFHALISGSIEDRLKNGPPLSHPIQRLWALALAGRLAPITYYYSNFYIWISEFNRDGLSASLKWRLRQMLSPYVQIDQPFRGDIWDDEEAAHPDQHRVSDLVRWEVALSVKDAHTAFEDLAQNEAWQRELPALLLEFTALLQDTMDLMAELGGADEHEDISYIHQPSIGEHEQNRDFNDWTVLIDLTRDSWMAAAVSDPKSARKAAMWWTEIRYPVFRRLLFFVAAQRPDIIPPEDSISFLLADDARWVWVSETKHEAIQLLASLASIVSEEENVLLQRVLLQGPPRQLFRDDIDDERLQDVLEWETCLRIANYKASGGALTFASSEKLRRFAERHPAIDLSSEERHQFSFWMGDGDDFSEFQQTPKSRRELEVWLQENPSPGEWQKDDWRDRCANDFPRTASALLGLAGRGVWPVYRWRQALQAWATEKHHIQSWKYISGSLFGLPEEEFKELSGPISWWLYSVSQVPNGDKLLFILIIKRIFDIYRNDPFNFSDDTMFRTVNHPVGLATQATLRWWYRQNLQDAQGLQADIEEIFTDLCLPESIGLRYGSIILSGNVISLFRVDRIWVERNLLGYFDWEKDSRMACAVWRSFLQSPRLYWPLLDVLKIPFLSTANHYSELGEPLGRQYVSFLTFAALSPEKTYNKQDFAGAFSVVPQEGLEEVAATLFRALQGAESHKEEYFKSRIRPFMENFWPRKTTSNAEGVSRQFSQICAVLKDTFPEALTIFRDWIHPFENISRTLILLASSGSCTAHPRHVVILLDSIIIAEMNYVPIELRRCLDLIAQSEPPIRGDAGYQRLEEIARMHNI